MERHLSSDDDDLWAETFDPYSERNWKESGRAGGMFELIEGEKRSRDSDPDRHDHTPAPAHEVAKRCYVLNRKGVTCEYEFTSPFRMYIQLLRSEPVGTVDVVVNNDYQAIFTTHRDPSEWPFLYEHIDKAFSVAGAQCAHCGSVITEDDDTVTNDSGSYHGACYEKLHPGY